MMLVFVYFIALLQFQIFKTLACESYNNLFFAFITILAQKIFFNFFKNHWNLITSFFIIFHIVYIKTKIIKKISNFYIYYKLYVKIEFPVVAAMLPYIQYSMITRYHIISMYILTASLNI